MVLVEQSVKSFWIRTVGSRQESAENEILPNCNRVKSYAS